MSLPPKISFAEQCTIAIGKQAMLDGIIDIIKQHALRMLNMGFLVAATTFYAGVYRRRSSRYDPWEMTLDNLIKYIVLMANKDAVQALLKRELPPGASCKIYEQSDKGIKVCIGFRLIEGE